MPLSNTPSSKLTFKNRQGNTLVARLDLPPKRPSAFALFAHCFTCSKDLQAVRSISGALTREGVGVLRFDFTGLGESEGAFADTNFSSNVEDLLDAAAYLEEAYAAPQVLIGHSLGGAAVLMAAAKLESVKAVATIAAPAEPEHVTGLFAASRDTIETEGKAEVSIAGRSFTVKKQFLKDLNETHMEETVRNLRRPLLIFHSPTDNTVGVENARKLFTWALHPKSFVSLDSADHLLSNRADADYVGHIVSAWAQKYVDSAPPSWQDDVNTQVAARTENGFRTDILAGGFALVADEPVKLGGTNAGPTPYDYLASALGACTSITLRMYADRKKWPLEAITVGVNHRKVHAEDCGEAEHKPKKLDRFERTITLGGDLSDEQRGRLLEIADRCPVHRTLEAQVEVVTELT